MVCGTQQILFLHCDGPMIWIIVIVVIVVLLGMTRFLASRALRNSEETMTGYFQALDALVEHETMPEQWKQVAARSARTLNKGPLIKKLDQLYAFFAGCPYVEDHQTRKVILNKLDSVMDMWEELDPPSLLAKYGIKAGKNV